REVLDVVEGRIARAEVVDGEAEALQLQVLDEVFEQGQVADRLALGDLEDDPRGRDVVGRGEQSDAGNEFADDQRLGRQVDEQHAVVADFLDVGEGLFDQLV